MTQKKILLKSMRALEFQCPLKFRCQTRDIIYNLQVIAVSCTIENTRDSVKSLKKMKKGRNKLMKIKRLVGGSLESNGYIISRARGGSSEV